MIFGVPKILVYILWWECEINSVFAIRKDKQDPFRNLLWEDACQR